MSIIGPRPGLWNQDLLTAERDKYGATLIGRYGTSDYGKSKLAGEELFFDYGKENGVKVAVYRFPNLMGHSRPNYNSAVSTFCHAVANDLPFTVNDRSTELELLYIDDLVEESPAGGGYRSADEPGRGLRDPCAGLPGRKCEHEGSEDHPELHRGGG